MAREFTTEQSLPEPREFRRQDILDALVHVLDANEGANLNIRGWDWVIAEGLNRQGYRLIGSVATQEELIPGRDQPEES